MLARTDPSGSSMGSYVSQQRALQSVSLAVLISYAASCASVLGVSEPVPRASAGGSGTDAGSDGAGESGASGSSSGSGGQPAGDAGLGGDAGSGGASGAAGDRGVPCQQIGAARCAGETGKAPEICNGEVWLPNTTETIEDDCPALCNAGKCVDCIGSSKRCVDNESQRCENGAWITAQQCAAYCLNDECVNPPSCALLGDRSCGDATNCCRALEVPGGSFIRDFDGKQYSSKAYTANVSSFLMDRFRSQRRAACGIRERLRQFQADAQRGRRKVAAYYGRLGLAEDLPPAG